MNLRSLWLAAIAALLLSVISVAQQSNDTSSSTPKFVSRSELVLVPVIVKDKKGHHLPGLTKDDFQVKEDGKPRKIELFEEVKTVGSISADRRTASDFSNFMPEDERPRRLMIIVLDLLNTPFLHQARAKQELLQFLSKNVPANEPMALLTLSSKGIRQIHPFTSDPKILVAALQKVRGEISNQESTFGLSAADVADIESEANGLDQFQQDPGNTDFMNFRRQENIRETMAAMEQISQAYAGVPGRKSLVWATSGFPFLLDDPRSLSGFSTDMVSSYERAWRALNQSNIAVYPIDARGLTNPVFDAHFSPSIRGSMTPRNRLPGMDNYQQTRATLESFAQATGGTACIDRNDLANCFRKAADDSEAYYMLGYYLGGEERKPGWHKLKVELNREHGQLRARSGFFFNDPKQVQQADLKTELGTALASPLDYTGIHLDFRWEPLTEASDPKTKRDAVFQITAIGSSLLVDTADNNRMSLEVAAIIRDPKGKYVSEYSRRVSGNLKPDSLSQVRRTGLTYRGRLLALDPGDYMVKFVVRDNISGALGTVTAPLTLRP